MHVYITALANKQNGKRQRTLSLAIKDCASPDIPILMKRSHGTGGRGPGKESNGI